MVGPANASIFAPTVNCGQPRRAWMRIGSANQESRTTHQSKPGQNRSGSHLQYKKNLFVSTGAQYLSTHLHPVWGRLLTMGGGLHNNPRKFMVGGGVDPHQNNSPPPPDLPVQPGGPLVFLYLCFLTNSAFNLTFGLKHGWNIYHHDIFATFAL